MSEVEFAEEREIERIIRWRLEQLQNAGYETQRARAIAQETEIDLHLAINLVSQDCPQTLAGRVLL